MFDIPISKMNDKQLRNAVQLLYDELAIFKRKYEDAIHNLDSDNLGKSFTVEQNKMKAQIKITADAISSMVSETDLENELSNYSTITQTAAQIELAVISVGNATDEKLKSYSTISQTADAITNTVTAEYVNNLIGSNYVTNAVFTATIEQTAKEIKQTVSATYQTKDDAADEYDYLYSEISQTADDITSIVSKNVSAYFTKTTRPTASNTTDEEQSMLCLYNGVYYYFNDVTNTWKTYPASGITTMFKQTSSGFELTGDVSISGDLISEGSIKGLSISTADNLYGDGVRLNSSTNRLEILYNGVVVGCWGYTTMPGGSSIYPAGGGTLTISGVDASGTWDFSGCDAVIGLPSTVAIFG